MQHTYTFYIVQPIELDNRDNVNDFETFLEYIIISVKNEYTINSKEVNFELIISENLINSYFPYLREKSIIRDLVIKVVDNIDTKTELVMSYKDNKFYRIFEKNKDGTFSINITAEKPEDVKVGINVVRKVEGEL